jgi:hypothetical protein
MVLSDRLGAKPQASLLRRTLKYMLGFGLASLAVTALLSFVLVSLAENAIPSARNKRPRKSKSLRVLTDKKKKRSSKAPSIKAPSKARPARAKAPKDPFDGKEDR